VTLYNISGVAPTTYEWWTPTPADPGTTSTDVVGRRRHARALSVRRRAHCLAANDAREQCTTTPTDFIFTEPTTVATRTDRTVTTTVTYYPRTITTTATYTVSYFA
jgi:hypothetical protein